MSSGFRSPLFQLGLSAAPAPAEQGGYRSFSALWIGGASAPAEIPVQGGYRGFLALWMGGASVPVARPGGDSRRREWLLRRGQIIREDGEFIEILAALIENEIIH